MNWALKVLCSNTGFKAIHILFKLMSSSHCIICECEQLVFVLHVPKDQEE